MGNELEQHLRATEVLQPVRSELPYGDVGRQGVLDESGGRRRQQDLASVADRGDPGRPVDLVADEAGGGLRRLAGVDAHADL